MRSPDTLRLVSTGLLAASLLGCAGPTVVAPSAAAVPSTTSSPVPSATEPPSATPTQTASPAPTPIPLLGDRPTAVLDGATSARLQATLDALVARGDPDAIAAVITPDGTWTGAAGEDGPDGRKADPDDMFAIASVSKVILATLVMRLVEEGVMDLDAPISTYLNDLDVDANGATVRQALEMRSGLGDTVSGAIADAAADCAHALTTDEVIATIPAPSGPPGDTFHYSNPTYKLLGWAAERASGMPLATALRMKVFEPAGATRILLQGPDAATPKAWAVPLEGHNGAMPLGSYGIGGALPCLADSTLSLGAAGMASDAANLARWGWDLFAGKIVSADSLASMTTIDNDGYGLGMERIYDLHPEVAYGHGGTKDGYKALLAVFPERRTVAVMFINDGNAEVAIGVRRLLLALDD